MLLKTLLKEMTKDERKKLAEVADCSFLYLYQVAGGHRLPSVRLAKRLVDADPRLTLHELRPDVW